MTISFDSDALYIALDRKRRNARLTWRGVGREAGVVPSMLTRISRNDATPSADNLVRLLLWLGTTDVKPFIKGGANGPPVAAHEGLPASTGEVAPPAGDEINTS